MKIDSKIIVVAFLCFMAFNGCKSDDDGGATEDFKAENRKGLGSSATDLLSSDSFNSMTVEFVYSAGFRPEQATIDNFITFLSDRVSKPGGINFEETMIEAPQGFPYTTSEIREIEDDTRTQYTVDDNVAVYIFFSNGNSDNDTDTSVTLGTAYQNTSIVLFEKTIREIAQQQNIDRSLLESTTLHHEFGHLFSLVNIQNDDIHTDHEDTNNAKHCVVEDCLMFFETRSTTRQEVQRYMSRSRAEIPTFDVDLCIEDLQAKGGK